jgi:oligosaccharide translocation protein RFT1
MATKTAKPATSETESEKFDDIPQSSLLSTSAQGATFLILIQVVSRALTFGVNQVVLRYISPEYLGISTQLELYLISALYFSRESLRVALQRQSWSHNNGKEKKPTADAGRRGAKKPATGREKPPSPEPVDADSPAGELQTVVNLSYLSIYIGVPLAFALGKIYLRSTSSEIRETPYFRESLDLYGVAVAFELVTEPAFVVVQHKMLYKTRAMVESVATLVRCLATCAIAMLSSVAGDDAGVLPFAVGQWAYASALFFMYYWQVWNIASDNGFSYVSMPISSRYDPKVPLH